MTGSSDFGEEDYEGYFFWCWWVSFLWEVEVDFGTERKRDDLYLGSAIEERGRLL